MWPYFALVGIPAIASLFCKKNDRKIVLSLFFAIWLILLMLRNETIGCDLYNYNILYNNSLMYSWKQILSFQFILNKDIGFYIVAKLIGTLGGNFRTLLVISSIWSIIPLWILYRKEIDNNYFLSIALFLNVGLFSFYFSGLRQLMAMSIGLLVYYFSKKKKLLLSLVLVLIAFLFHKSALILILIYPFLQVKIKRKSSLLIILPVIMVIYIFRGEIFSSIGVIIGDYFDTTMQNTGAISMFVLCVLLLLYSFLMGEQSCLDDETCALRNLMIVSCILQIFAGVHVVAMRLNYYYLPFVPVLITKIIKHCDQKYIQIANVSIVIMTGYFIFNFFYTAYTGADILNVFPYEFLWDGGY